MRPARRIKAPNQSLTSLPQNRYNHASDTRLQNLPNLWHSICHRRPILRPMWTPIPNAVSTKPDTSILPTTRPAPISTAGPTLQPAAIHRPKHHSKNPRDSQPSNSVSTIPVLLRRSWPDVQPPVHKRDCIPRRGLDSRSPYRMHRLLYNFSSRGHRRLQHRPKNQSRAACTTMGLLLIPTLRRL